MTLNGPQTPPPPSRPLPSPPAPRDRPWWKGIWFVGAVALVGGVIIGVAGGSGASDKPETASTVHVVTTTTATATTTQSITESATVTATPTVVKTIATRTRTQTVTYTPPPPKAYTDGTYVVGSEIQPGVYHADGGAGYCAWIRLSTLSGATSGSGIIDLGNTSNGPLTVEISSTDKAFEVQGESCSFHRMG